MSCANTPLKLSLDDEITLCLLLAELIADSLKHGFADGRAGSIVVDLLAVDENTGVLIVQDDGTGFRVVPNAVAPANGLGQMIMQSLAAKLGGHLAVSGVPGEGAVARVTFPLR